MRLLALKNRRVVVDCVSDSKYIRGIRGEFTLKAAHFRQRVKPGAWRGSHKNKATLNKTVTARHSLEDIIVKQLLQDNNRQRNAAHAGEGQRRMRSGKTSTALRRAGGITLALVLMGVGTARITRAAHEADTILLDTFETDANGWTALGPHANAGTTNESGKVKNGKNALAFNYRIDTAPANPGEPPIDALVRPVREAQLAGARSVSFWVRSDADAPLALALTERMGGRYTAGFWVSKNQWQHVVLALDDFTLGDGKDDPKDLDGKLDMDQVENIALINLHAFVALSLKDTPLNATLFPLQNGPRALWMDDFSVSRASAAFDTHAPTLPEGEKSGLWVDALRRDTPGWLPLGAVEMKIDANAPTKGRALRLDYTQQMGKITAALRDVHATDLSRYDHLEFDIASAKTGRVLLVLEEKTGARYQTVLDVEGGSVSSRKAIYFANLAVADDGPKDANGKLDLDQIKNLSFVDVTAFLNTTTQPSTLWIGPIRASKNK